MANTYIALLALVYFILLQSETVESYLEMYSNAVEKEIERYRNISRTTWPSQLRYGSLHILNLNDYIQLFEHCLINVENYQGIDFSESKTPLLLSRLGIKITRCNLSDETYILREIFFGKSDAQDNCEKARFYDRRDRLPFEYKFSVGRWACYAKFELLSPEIKEAPHIFRFKNVNGNKEFFIPYINLYEDAEPGKI